MTNEFENREKDTNHCRFVHARLKHLRESSLSICIDSIMDRSHVMGDRRVIVDDV